jgi:hypothetical protein
MAINSVNELSHTPRVYEIREYASVGSAGMTDLWLVLLVTSAICGVVGYLYAKKTGRNPGLWAALGVVLNVVVVAILASKDAQKGRPPSRRN